MRQHLRAAGLRGAVALLFALTSLAAAQDKEDRPTLPDELKERFFPVVNYISRYYMYEIPADSLMRAGLRGIFRSLDPASDYELHIDTPDWRENFITFEQIARTVDAKAYYSVAPDTLVRYGIAGMMSILDPDTVFMENVNLDNFRIDVDGEYGGLGFRIQVVYPDSAIGVWSLVHPDAPAARAGVQSGDLILSIDGESTKEMDASDAADRMRGKAGTDVTLTLSRAGTDAPFDLTVTREEIHLNSVPYAGMLSEETGYIRLSGFQHKCSAEVREALRSLLDEGMERLVFDLRGNSGGYLHEAVAVADLFLPKDRLVVYTAGRAFQDTTKLYTENEALFGEGPLIILVDGRSASASEIVAGTIQDWDRGLVLGTQTVGKGSVQQPVKIGERAELKLTISAYFIPSGRSIDRRMRKDSTLVAMAEQEYTTLGLKRRVRGAGGITPDIQMERRQTTALYHQLEGWRTLNSRFFRFSRDYVAHHEIGEDFVADDKVLEAFRDYTDGAGFEYISSLEHQLQQLRQNLAEEDNAGRADRHLSDVAEEIEQIEERHWNENDQLLRWKLTFDIREKAHGIGNAYIYDTRVNPQVMRAEGILSDDVEYSSWFERPEIGATTTASLDSTDAEGPTHLDD
ncbi:MAG: hypothetical protein CME13_17135 [Gemmatimonadetes bacterium]|nr:hypothetical protein [Gemmatimonadota bacterium]MDP7362272.1 S41 family peptidase [Candidatus Latescibacterota bacterium]HCV24276.1 hypothetical protein [Candidatus Latescibacterota bacterium]|tara:strand:+ start:746 stop:2635 length:1890 start_codon:yes stop_codon:yes gene_type:complete